MKIDHKDAPKGRPEYVKCVADVHVNNAGKSWCGRSIAREFSFAGVDHAALNGRGDGRLVACPECTALIIKALSNGQVEA